MMTNPVGSLTAMNAAYNWMSSANALSALSFRGGMSSSNRDQEMRLRLSMLNNGVEYKAGLLMEESNQRLKKKNIESTFNVFA